MIKLNRLILILTLTQLVSCTYLIKKIEDDNDEQYQLKNRPSVTVCEKENSKFSVFSSHPDINQKMTLISTDMNSKRRYQFIDKAVTWTLLQLQGNPHLAGPYSRLDVVIGKAEDYEYLNLSNQTIGKDYHLGKGLRYLLEKYKSRHSLNHFTKMIDKYAHKKISVSKDFAQFLHKHSDEIAASNLRNFYYKGDEILRQNESMPEFSMNELFSNVKTTPKINSPLLSFLFRSDREKVFDSAHVTCNFDIDLYQNSIFPIKNESDANVYSFGMSDGDHYFMATLSNDYQLAPVRATLFFDGKHSAKPMATCEYQSSDDKKFVFISTGSRDNGQLLYHLLRYDLSNVKSHKDLDYLLKFSRHLFLTNPPRLIYESLRGKEKQLEKLLTLNFPIYHARNIGKIESFFSIGKESGAIIDERYTGDIVCQK